jgi:uncharacterized protein
LLDEWQRRLEAVVIARSASNDGSHDIGHCRRVWRVARQIAGGLDEPVDLFVLIAAAYLHDIVSLEKNDPRRMEASRMAAAEARIILSGLDFPRDKLDAVAHVIEAHSYSAKIAPLTVEAKILADADRMETLGAIGIARIFYVGGRIGTKLFDEDDPLAQSRPLDDLRFSLDHFYTKILTLAGTMNTVPGRALAEERTRFIRQFLSVMLSEVRSGAMQD